MQAEGIIGVKLAGAGGVGALDVPRGDLGVVFGHLTVLVLGGGLEHGLGVCVCVGFGGLLLLGLW